MSRIAKNPVVVPSGVEVALAAGEISVKGPLGTLKQTLSGDVSVVREGNSLLCKAQNDTTQADAMSGTIRALLANMVLGVSKGFERKLTLVGVGYRGAFARRANTDWCSPRGRCSRRWSPRCSRRER